MQRSQLESRLRSCSRLFVSPHSFEAHSVDPGSRAYLHAGVPDVWAAGYLALETSPHLRVLNPFVFAYYSGLNFRGSSNRAKTVCRIAMVKLVVLKLILIVVCGRYGTGLTSAEDCRLVAQDFQTLLTSLPLGIVAAADVMGFSLFSTVAKFTLIWRLLLFVGVSSLIGFSPVTGLGERICTFRNTFAWSLCGTCPVTGVWNVIDWQTVSFQNRTSCLVGLLRSIIHRFPSLCNMGIVGSHKTCIIVVNMV